MRISVFSLLSMSFTLAACTTPMPYQEPIDGDRAKVRFRTELERVEVFHQHGNPCQPKLRIAVLSQREKSRDPSITSLGMPSFRGGSINTTTEKYVTANRPLYLSFEGSSYSYISTKCALPFGFVPEPGENYEVTFYHEPKLCLVKVEKIAESEPEEYKRLPVAMFKPVETECKSASR